MTHWDDDDDDWDDDEPDDGDDDDRHALSAAERPDPSDLDPAADDDQTLLEPCPFCGRAVFEGADVCPGCRNFIGGADEPAGRRPLWITVGLVLCLLGMLVGLLAAWSGRMW